MDVSTLPLARQQIVDRRGKLEAAVTALGPRPELVQLLAEVDAALGRLDLGTYGLCETCHEPVEADRLLADPLTRFCLDHLTPVEQRALEHDLELATRIQRGLLPNPAQTLDGWEFAYHYQPARIVSGDYCDVIGADGATYFLLGDVSGKGVAASMLMSHLHAMVRALISVGLPLATLMERASRVFCESTLPMHYATLVCGRATADGEVEICNAGHVPPLVIREDGVRLLEANGLPVGLFSAERFAPERLRLASGESLVLCTDGVTEAVDAQDREYGLNRLSAVACERTGLGVHDLVKACVRDLTEHCSAAPLDDVTIMVVRRR
jgi:sigma-B regulation protein RsbU (phosphoserine phosphatase)